MPDTDVIEQNEPEVSFVDNPTESQEQETVTIDTNTEGEEQPEDQPAEKQGEETTEKPAETKPEETATEQAKPAEAQTPPTTPPAERPQATAPVDPLEALGIPKEQQTLVKAAIDAIKAGDFDNFARIRATDWDKVPDLDILRHKLEQQYKDLDKEERDFMVSSELEKYDTSTFDETAARKANILLKLEAKSVRDGLKAEQAQYQVPVIGPSPEEVAEQEQQKQAAVQFEKAVLSDPALKDFETKKVVQLGTGEQAFNYAADKFDARQAISKGVDVITYDENGKPTGFNMPKFLKAALFAEHGDDIADKLIKHGIMLGKRERDAELRNPGTKPAAAASADKSDVKWHG